jgi:hypothetical protein
VSDRYAYKWGQRYEIRALALVALAVGVAILVGGHTRFDHAPAFATARTVLGGYYTWGLLMIAVGGWTLGASLRWKRPWVMVGLLMQCVIFAFFTITLVMAAWQTPTTAWTGVAIYGGYSVLCAIAYVVGHELRRAGA